MRGIDLHHGSATGSDRVLLHELEKGHQFVDRAASGRRRLRFRWRRHRCRRFLRFDRRLSDGLPADGGITPATPSTAGRGGGDVIALLGLAYSHPTLRAANRVAVDEDPTDVWDRLATDQASLVEQPFVLAVEFLERVVRQHVSIGFVGNRQHERIAAADGSGRWSDQFVVGDRLVEVLDFPAVDPVPERGVDDDRDDRSRVVVHERHHCLVQLQEARLGSTFGGDIGPVDHEVAGLADWSHCECFSIRCRGGSSRPTHPSIVGSRRLHDTGVADGAAGMHQSQPRSLKTSSIISPSSWSWTAFDPVAGLPDSTRATCCRS